MFLYFSDMANNKHIIFGLGRADGYGTMADVNVTSINIDSHFHIATFITEQGANIKSIKMSVENAQKVGIINLKPLLEYLNDTRRSDSPDNKRD